jgi:ribosome-binding protein aMBF1 (putative translation factor)
MARPLFAPYSDESAGPAPEAVWSFSARPRPAAGRPARALTPSLSARHRFGAELRRWRLDRGLTHRRLGALLWHSAELVAKVEKGQRWPTHEFAEGCDRVLGTGGALLALWPAVEAQRLASDGRRKRHGAEGSQRPAEPGVE